MTWTRLDDRWTERPDLAELSYEVRWHYLGMIQFCSRTDRLTGFLRVADARRASDVEDPDAAHQALILAGLLEQRDGQLVIREIHDHIPPPSVRNESAEAAIRMRRSRAHAVGDHSLCLPKNCDQAPVTPLVTRNTRTGQDRTRLDQELPTSGGENDDDDGQFVKASAAS